MKQIEPKYMKEIIYNLLEKLEDDQPFWTDIEIKKYELQQFSNTNILSDIYFVDLEFTINHSRESKELVLKLAVSPASSITAIWKSEHEVMTALYSLGYPVPQVYSFSMSLSPELGAYILMERVSGESLVNLLKIAKEEEFQALISSYNEVAVKLHNLTENGSVPILGRKNQFFTNGDPSPLNQFVNDYLRFANNLGYQTLADIASRLMVKAEKLNSPLILGITHGDMQTNNLIYFQGKMSTVIDWGFAKTADIRLDIYWNYLLNGFDFGKDKSNQILEGYLNIQTRSITDEEFFIPLSCLRLLIGLSQLASSSKKYHSKVDKMLRAADIPWMQEILNTFMGASLAPIDEEFRIQLGMEDFN